MFIFVALLSVIRSSERFLKEYNAQHRYSAFKKAFKPTTRIITTKECSHYKPMYANTWNDYTQITPTQKELLP